MCVDGLITSVNSIPETNAIHVPSLICVHIGHATSTFKQGGTQPEVKIKHTEQKGYFCVLQAVEAGLLVRGRAKNIT